MMWIAGRTRRACSSIFLLFSCRPDCIWRVARKPASTRRWAPACVLEGSRVLLFHDHGTAIARAAAARVQIHWRWAAACTACGQLGGGTPSSRAPLKAASASAGPCSRRRQFRRAPCTRSRSPTPPRSRAGRRPSTAGTARGQSTRSTGYPQKSSSVTTKQISLEYLHSKLFKKTIYATLKLCLQDKI